MRGQFNMEKTQKWKSQFMIVALGQAVSMLGSHGVQFALIWWLAEKTSSPLMLGISGLVAYLPMTLFSPLAGNVHTIPLTAYMQETISPDKMGAGIFGFHADFIRHHAGRLTFQQSDSRKGRGKCMVLHFRSVYDCTYCRRFLTVCGRMSEQDAAAVNIIPSVRNVLRRISPGSQERILLCRILRLRWVAQATSSIPPQCDPRGAFSQFFCRTTVWPSSIQ